MKKYILSLLWVVSFMMFSTTAESSKSEQIQTLLTIVEELHQEAVINEDKRDEFKEFRKHVEESVNDKIADISDSPLLAQLALITRAIYFPGDAGDVRFDEVFFQAHHVCIVKLIATISEENYRALKTIESHLCLGAGDSVMFKEILLEFECHLGKSLESSETKESPPPQRIQPSESTSKDPTDSEIHETIQQVLRELDTAPSPEELFGHDEATEAPSKQERIREFIAIMNALYHQAIHVSEREYTDAAIQEMAEQTLVNVHDPEELGRLASVAWWLYSFGESQDGKFDRIFHYAYRACIEKLASNPCRDTYIELENLGQCRLCLKGEEQQFFEEKLHEVIQHLKENDQWPIM